MKTFRMIGCAIFAILLCLSACSGGGDDPIEPTPKPEVTKSEITIDSNIINNGLSFSNAKGEQSISFSANEDWTLSVASTTSGATWCTASATNGSKGSASVKFSVTENTDYDNRSVSVTIKSGTASKTFTISQKSADALLVTADKYEVSQEGGTIDIEVKANIEYKMEISETAKDWISDSSGRGLTSYKHSLNIAMNEENEKREGEIYFKSGEKADTVKVYQLGGPIILLSQNEYSVSDTGDTISVDVRSNIEYGVQMPDADWIIDESSSRGMSSHTLKYIITSNEDYDTRSANIIFYDKNSELKDTLTISQQGKVFETDYVDLRFDDPNVTTTYNATDGSLTVTYPSGSLPSIEAGNSIVLPAEYGFDIRVIDYVSTSGNTLTMWTSQGNMSNLFRNTSFTLTSDPSVASRSAGSNVYTPSAYGYIDENGEFVEIYNEATASRKVYPLNQNFWEFYQDFNGDKIYEGEAGTLYWDKCEFNAGLKGTFTFDFGEKEIDEVRKVGDLKKFGYKLTGNVGMDLLLHYEYEYEYDESEDEIVKKNVIPTKYIKFVVGTVPVVILIDTHLGKFTECRIRGSIDEEDEESTKLLDATAGVKLGTEVSVGVEWTPGSGVVPTREVKPTFEVYPFTVEARAHAEAKVSYYPQIVIGIYKFLGPWLETRPYLKETVDAGFYYSAHGDDNYIGWKAETYNGMDLRMGLNLDFGIWEKELWHSDLYNCIPDRLLFEAPSRIRTLSPENNIIVDKGETVKAEFMVESFSPITNQFYPCPWALVNFEQEYGELNKPLAVSDIEGKATVDWTPGADNIISSYSRSAEYVNRKLTAKIVDGGGKTIDETGVVVKVEDELREALIKLYESTNGDNWERNDNWCSDKPLSEWYGVELCEEKREVHYWNGIAHRSFEISEGEYYIELSDNNLTGTVSQVFPNDLGVSINLSDNQLSLFEIVDCNSLKNLLLSGNQMISLDVSGCTSLIVLTCQEENQLKTLDVSGCNSLRELNCFRNQLSSLNVSGCTSLTSLSCYSNQLTSLDVSGCSSLKELECYRNELTSLDVSGCTSLTNLSCGVNQLTSLDVSGCTALTSLNCNSNQLTSLNVSGCTALTSLNCNFNQLTSLNVSGHTSLTSLFCYDNQLTSLNISGCTSLTSLDCHDNQLTSLDASGTAIKEMWPSNFNENPFITLDFSDCKSLEIFDCDFDYYASFFSGTKLYETLITLNLSGCTSLKEVDCSGCGGQLTSLNVTGCTSLTELYCSSNQLTSLDVSTCRVLEALICGSNKIRSVIPDWFSQLRSFGYDVRYEYYDVKIGDRWVTQHKDKGYGWWYPGEPGKGYHGPN